MRGLRVPGQNHAEIEALQQAGDVSGGTLYVTLEPCSHQGRTGPCSQAVIEAKLARVVIACEDPNPEVCGTGINQLQAAGIEVEVGLFEDQARELNKGFFKRHTQGMPWILIKMASLDGRTAMASGQSRGLLRPQRVLMCLYRAKSCTIITGIGTQLMDDPSLTVRITEEDLGIIDPIVHPLKVVVDAQLKLSDQARILQAPGHCLVATIDAKLQREKSQALIGQEPM